MEGHKALFWSKEAIVDKLAKGYFWDKLLLVKALFEIDEHEQKGLNAIQNAPKHGVEEKFSFYSFWHIKPSKSGKAAYVRVLLWLMEAGLRR